jgi:hypothetical protein
MLRLPTGLRVRPRGAAPKASTSPRERAGESAGYGRACEYLPHVTDFAMGSVVYEIEIMLSSDSGRSKHTDVEEQGAWLALAIKQALTSIELNGAAFGRLRYWGQRNLTGTPVSEEEIGGYVRPYHEQLAADRLGLLRDYVAGRLNPEVVQQVDEWARGQREGGDLSESLRSVLFEPFEPRDENGVE